MKWSHQPWTSRRRRIALLNVSGWKVSVFSHGLLSVLDDQSLISTAVSRVTVLTIITILTTPSLSLSLTITMSAHLPHVPHSRVLEWHAGCREHGLEQHLTTSTTSSLHLERQVAARAQCGDHGAVWRRDQTRGHWAQRRSTGGSPAQVESAATATASRGS